MAIEKNYLNPPKVKRVRYQQNFINNAVCELRFPTILELNSVPPKGFQEKVRKEYPYYEAIIVEQVGAPTNLAKEQRYIFRSKDRKWTVTLRSSAIAIETSEYYIFKDFYSRLADILKSANKLIDSDFYTRVGLRYINSIPVKDESLEGWLNPNLISPLTCGVLGSTKSSATVIKGHLNNGGYSLRHGFNKEEDAKENSEVTSYKLDFDYFKENVEATEIEALLNNFNETNFYFFSWCIGDKAKQVLGKGEPK